jgi:uncharacterized protein YndB with AHSA1/START domain
MEITIQTNVNAPIEKVWDCFTSPIHITQWNFASPEWHCPAAENNLVVDGTFSYKMAAKDGSFEFDFIGKYTYIDNHKKIHYVLGDGRSVKFFFEEQGDHTLVTETFDAEEQHSAELQRSGWQAILDNFKKHVESLMT